MPFTFPILSDCKAQKKEPLAHGKRFFSSDLRQNLVHFRGIRLLGTVDDRDDPNTQYLRSESDLQYIANLDIVRSLGRTAVDGDMGAITRLIGHRASFDNTGYLQILV